MWRDRSWSSPSPPLGILGYQVSSHAFAWLFAGITVNLVVMSSLQDPTLAFHYAFYRTAEVAIGAAVALVIAFALAPDGGAAPPPPPGWRQLWARDWPRVLHAMRCGLTVMLLPWVWSWFNQLSLTQMSVTVAVIMAVPVAPGDPLESGRRMASQSLQRVMGCFIGGLAGLLLLALSLTEFLPWLLALSGSPLGRRLYPDQHQGRGVYRDPGGPRAHHDPGPGMGTAGQHPARHRPLRRHDGRAWHLDGRIADFLARAAEAGVPGPCGKLAVTEP